MDDGATVRDETLLLNGLRFHYRDWGDPEAPPLVLLHAYTQHARSWDTVARALADRFRVLALDQRGHGESDLATDYHEQRLVDDFAAFVHALGLARFSAVGFSIGGNGACAYAVLHPDQVERLVLVECFTEGIEPEAVAHLRILQTLPETFAAPEDAAAAFRPLAPYAPEEELLGWMAGGLAQGPDGRFGWHYDPGLRRPGPPGRLVASMDVFWERLAQVRCPTLLIVGADSWMPEPVAQAARNPRVRTATIPDAGHWVPLDNPTGFLSAVRPFLTT
jgi:pimeloyl-ACP methyl ester carboxylesterase